MTETFDLAPKLFLKMYWKLMGWSRGRTNTRGMTQTLNKIKAELETASEPVRES